MNEQTQKTLKLYSYDLARMALNFLGPDASLDDCNWLLQRLRPDLHINDVDLRTARELIERDLGGRIPVTTADCYGITAIHLLHSSEGRRAFAQVLGSIPPEELMDLFCALSFTIEFAVEGGPPRVTVRAGERRATTDN